MGILWQIISKLFNFDQTPPYGLSTVIVLIIFFGGINLLGISFLGKYISRIFEETKKRPKFIRTMVRKGERVYKTAAGISTLVEQRRSK